MTTPPFLKLPEVRFPNFSTNIMQHGAIPITEGSSTPAFAQAIASCVEQGGGTVIVPPGHWETGPIHFQSNIRLHLEEGSIVSFSRKFEDYLPPVFCQRGGCWLYNYSPLLYAHNAENIGITGSGTLDGQGDAWWDWKQRQPGMVELFQMAAKGVPVEERVFGTEEAGVRPPMLQFIECKNVQLQGFTIKNSPSWTIHPVCCDNLTLSGLTILGNGPNTDGIDPDSCRNMLIEDCFIDTGDDCLVLKAGRDEDAWKLNRPTENLVVRRLKAHRGHGGFVIGSEISAGVRNVWVEDCDFTGTDIGIRIKTAPGKGGFIENIHIQNVKMEQIRDEAILITMAYGMTSQGTVAGWSFQAATTTPTRISGISIQDVDCQGAQRALEITGDVRLPIRDVQLRNINIGAASGPLISHSQNVSWDNVNFTILEKEQVPAE